MNQIIKQNVKKDRASKLNHLPFSDSHFKIEFGTETFYIPYDTPSTTSYSNTESKAFYKEISFAHHLNIIKQFLKKNKYQLLFIISCIIGIILLFMLGFQYLQYYRMEKISEKLLQNYSITTLYAPTENSEISQTISEQSVSNPFVIGILKIDKINLNYPVLSNSNRDLLKISLCRFAGPMLNEIGNVCIAGHNLVDNKLFSRLHELEKNDSISVFDLYGKEILYNVYDKYEVKPQDLSCTSQSVGENRILTLLTCNNVNGKRLVVKAKEK